MFEPEYKEIGDVGPPHARTFTIQCSVSTFVEKGTASTKKRAKHEAAKKMLDHIKSIFGDDIGMKDVAQEDLEEQPDSAKTALNLYPKLSAVYNETVKSKVNWGLKIIKMHQEFKKNLPEEIKQEFFQKLQSLDQVLNDYLNKFNAENISSFTNDLKTLLELIEIKADYSDLSSIQPNTEITNLKLDTEPVVNEIGLGPTKMQATYDALKKVVTVLIMLSR